MEWMILSVVGILLVLIYLSGQLTRKYRSEVKKGIERTSKQKPSVLTEQDIEHLPEPVQKYLRLVGVVGKEKVNNYRAEFIGSMKTDKNRDWMDVKISQYSFIDNLTRLFYIKAVMFGLPIVGLHFCTSSIAHMVIKIAGLLTVVNGRGEEMNQAETVTVFNDMCLLAPATLIDNKIKWQLIDFKTVKATFKNGKYTISALLYFDDEGKLINFESEDRYFSPSGKTFESAKWSTPIMEYKKVKDYYLPSYAEAFWSLPDGDFTYVRFHVHNIEYNVSSTK